jgi:DNA polymerase-3 subunit epsilon
MKTAIFYDTETTNLPLWKQPSDHPDQPHMVELAASLVNLETREIIRSINVIIKPDGWVIPQEVVNIHGITNERALEDGIPEKDAISMLLAMKAEAEEHGPVLLVGHNESFDRRIARIAIKRYLDRPLVEGEADPGDQPSDKWKNQVAYCTCWQAHKFTKLPKNKKPKLVEAFQHFTGLPMADAHSAGGDVDGCMTVYFAIQDLLNPPAAVAPELQAA